MLALLIDKPDDETPVFTANAQSRRSRMPLRGAPKIAWMLLASSLVVSPALAQDDADEPASISQPVVQRIPGKDSMTLNEALTRLGSNPRDVGALIDAGNAALTMGDVDAATGFFRRADQISPGNPKVKAGLAGAMVRNGNPFDAIPLFQEAERAGAIDPVVAGDRGLAYDLVGDNAAAQRYYRIALAAGTSDEISRRLALSLAIAGDRKGSDAALSSQLRQQDQSAWRTRAFALAILGQTEEAVTIARTILPGDLATAIAPYLRYMPRLTPAQQASAANFGAFPRASEIGRDDPRVALYAPAARRPVVASADAGLVPRGKPLGRAAAREERERTRREERAQRDAQQAREAAARNSRASTARVAPGNVQPTIETAANARLAVAAPLPSVAAGRSVQTELPPVAARPVAAPPVAARPVVVAAVPVAPAVVQPVSRPPAPATAIVAVAPPAVAPVNRVFAVPAAAPATTVVTATAPATGGVTAPPQRPVVVSTVAAPNGPTVTAGISMSAPVVASDNPNPRVPLPEPGFDLGRLPAGDAARPAAPISAPASTPVVAIPAVAPPQAVPAAPAPPPTPVAPRPSLASAFADLGRPSTDAVPAAGAVDIRRIRPTRPKPPEGKDAKPPPPSHPSRIWVQIATGRDKAALTFDWRRLIRQSADTFKGKTPSVSAWGQSNRLLTGPFASEAAANAFISQLRRANVDGPFVWTSPAGQIVDALSAR